MPRKAHSVPENPNAVRLSYHIQEHDLESANKWRKSHDITASGLHVKCPPPILSFENAPFIEPVRTMLQTKYSQPTPIQSQGWSVVMSGHNMVGVAKTGSGKTLGFILPALQHILNQPRGQQTAPHVLVLAPTRELAQQIEEEARQVCGHYRVRVVCLFGGTGNRGRQMASLRNYAPQLVVATPGRLLDMSDFEAINLSKISLLVLDEADRMLDMGFGVQLRQILERIPTEDQRQTLMWTATWSKEVDALARDYVQNFIKLNIGHDQLSANSSIKQEIVMCDEYERFKKLREILSKHPQAKLLIFVSKKVDCEHLGYKIFSELKLTNIATIHGDKSQDQRNNVIEDFRKNVLKVVIATDVAARGLDVKDIDFVINYDFPGDMDTYVHRIGRTGRAGKTGVSISFLTPSNYALVSKLIEVLKLSNQHVDDELIRLKNSQTPIRGVLPNQGRNSQNRNFNPNLNSYGDKFTTPGSSRSSFSGRGSSYQPPSQSSMSNDWLSKPSFLFDSDEIPVSKPSSAAQTSQSSDWLSKPSISKTPKASDSETGKEVDVEKWIDKQTSQIKGGQMFDFLDLEDEEVDDRVYDTKKKTTQKRRGKF